MIGTIQLVFFKQFWSARFSDTQLMMGGMTLFAAAQLLVINWGPVCTQILPAQGSSFNVYFSSLILL